MDCDHSSNNQPTNQPKKYLGKKKLMFLYKNFVLLSTEGICFLSADVSVKLCFLPITMQIR